MKKMHMEIWKYWLILTLCLPKCRNYPKKIVHMALCTFNKTFESNDKARAARTTRSATISLLWIAIIVVQWTSIGLPNALFSITSLLYTTIVHTFIIVLQNQWWNSNNISTTLGHWVIFQNIFFPRWPLTNHAHKLKIHRIIG